MTKHFPSAELKVDITPVGDVKKIMSAVEAKAGTGYFMVPPTELHIMDNFNVRVRSTSQWEEQVKALMDSIRANGFMGDKPIAVAADADSDGENKLWVVDGHTRLEAVYRLINEGVEIEAVPVIVKPKNTTFEDMLVALVTSNSGSPLTSYETSLVVKRLQNYGWDDAKVAERLGLSTKHVGNLTVLAGAPAKIRNQVVAGKLSASEAVRLIRKHGGKAVEVAEEAVQAAAKAGKKKATPKITKAVTATAAVEGPTALDAVNYALDVANDIEWLRRWRAGDAEAREELVAFTDPNGGL